MQEKWRLVARNGWKLNWLLAFTAVTLQSWRVAFGIHPDWANC